MNLVSIIIPTFNRALLLPETLDSILAQTYTHWECIVVDDGSTDGSQKVFKHYGDLDKRFKFLKRPSFKPKGANACRNIGFENATGDCIVFFDSDDLMTPNHLEVKLNALANSKYDYVITRTKYFNKENAQLDKYYRFDQFKITPYNYITQKINWLTLDVCVKTSLAKQAKFNESLQSGQEYNYFSKLVLMSTKGIFIDEVVSLRRHHKQSIRSQLKSSKELRLSYFATHWHTFLETRSQIDKPTKQFLLKLCSLGVMDGKSFFGINVFLFYFHLLKVFGFTTFYHVFYILGMRLFNKGYYFRSQFLKNS